MLKASDYLTAADIYVQELELLGWGYPIYCPHREIHIGDVGFFRRDRPDHPFERLFNVLCDANDPANAKYGVPEGFVTYQAFTGTSADPFEIEPKIHRAQRLFSESSVHRDVKLKASSEGIALGGAEVTYTLFKETSAVLTLRSTATRTEIIDKGSWRKYIASGIGFWYTFARSLGFEEEQAPDDSIVLIKGCDKAQSWEHATFRTSSKGASITFSALASIPGAPQSLVAEFSGSYTTTQNLCPEIRQSDDVTPPAGPPTFDVNPADHSYTVFARFYKIGYRNWMDRLRGKRTVHVKGTHPKSSSSFLENRSSSSSSNTSSGASSQGSMSGSQDYTSSHRSASVSGSSDDDFPSDSASPTSEISIEMDSGVSDHACRSILDEVLDYMAERQQDDNGNCQEPSIAIVTHDDLMSLCEDAGINIKSSEAWNILRASSPGIGQSSDGWVGLATKLHTVPVCPNQARSVTFEERSLQMTRTEASDLDDNSAQEYKASSPVHSEAPTPPVGNIPERDGYFPVTASDEILRVLSLHTVHPTPNHTLTSVDNPCQVPYYDVGQQYAIESSFSTPHWEALDRQPRSGSIHAAESSAAALGVTILPSPSSLSRNTIDVICKIHDNVGQDTVCDTRLTYKDNDRQPLVHHLQTVHGIQHPHLNSHAPGDPVIECPDVRCVCRFRRKSCTRRDANGRPMLHRTHVVDIVRHYMDKHLGYEAAATVSKFSCDLCGKGFTRHGSMTRHRRNNCLYRALVPTQEESGLSTRSTLGTPMARPDQATQTSTRHSAIPKVMATGPVSSQERISVSPRTTSGAPRANAHEATQNITRHSVMPQVMNTGSSGFWSLITEKEEARSPKLYGRQAPGSPLHMRAGLFSSSFQRPEVSLPAQAQLL